MKQKKVQENIIALDLGTTTLSVAVVDPDRKEIIETGTAINHQRGYGADVISRIQAAREGKAERLQKIVCEDIAKLVPGTPVPGTPVPVPLILSANTTMQHLLEGLSCEGLGSFPYQPVRTDLHCFDLSIGSQQMEVTCLPGISAFVGADIVSGIVACGIDRREEICVLMDLGTNGELVIGNRDRILVASTAAGPVFEGGSIFYGMPAVAGAICAVTLSGKTVEIRTMEDDPAAGICGSGVIDIVYELYKEGIMDETGLLVDPYFETGFPLTMNCMGPDIVFTQKDIRQVQLAKAAIRGGLETLMEEYGADVSQIGKVYLAGGLGAAINVKKAVGIGLLPEALEEKTTAVGNSSLKGAVLLAKNRNPEPFVQVAKSAKEVFLAEHPYFKKHFMEYMNFPK